MTPSHTPQYFRLQQYRCENLKSRGFWKCLLNFFLLPPSPLHGRFCPLFLCALGKPSVRVTFRSTVMLYSMLDAQLFLPPHRNVCYCSSVARFPVSSRISHTEDPPDNPQYEGPRNIYSATPRYPCWMHCFITRFKPM
jgi:hypothetical protein